MRTVTYGGASSLDGFILGPDGGIDWIQMSKDVESMMTTYWASIDTLLMGRKTWEFATAGGTSGGSFGKGITTYVFSRTLPEIRQRGVTLVREDAGAFVRALKEQPGKGICVFGGGELARSLLDAGVVDEVGFAIQPVLLGGGVPMVALTGGRVALELTECRALEGGTVYVSYRVRPPAPPPRARRARSRAKQTASV